MSDSKIFNDADRRGLSEAAELLVSLAVFKTCACILPVQCEQLGVLQC